MQFGIISLFPEMFQALNVGITGRAQKDKLLELQIWNPRDFTTDKHQTVDARPYGGGPGMVMMAEPLQAAIHAAKQVAKKPPTVIYLSPQGKPFNQAAAQELVEKGSLILVAGRYEGIDERLIEQEIDEEWTIGDYILTGGELAAMVMIDAMTRLIPGAVGDQASVTEDSLTSGLLKYPQYTRPELINNLPVPPVLVSGNHKEINRWRLKASLGKTWLRRPDLLARKELSKEEATLLDEFIKELPK
ncbi:MAG: tRNA (guanosine(37)-N1)-methyltransferase TrmD [Gammaproteobacteria bacterium]